MNDFEPTQISVIGRRTDQFVGPVSAGFESTQSAIGDEFWFEIGRANSEGPSATDPSLDVRR